MYRACWAGIIAHVSGAVSYSTLLTGSNTTELRIVPPEMYSEVSTKRVVN